MRWTIIIYPIFMRLLRNIHANASRQCAKYQEKNRKIPEITETILISPELRFIGCVNVAPRLTHCLPRRSTLSSISKNGEGTATMPNDLSHNWTPKRAPTTAEVAMPSWPVAIGRGLRMRCPACGQAPIFQGYLKVNAECAACAAPLGRVPSDDAPPYITLLLSLHVIAIILVLADRHGQMSAVTAVAIFVPLIIILELLLLRPVKGMVIAVLLKVDMLRKKQPAQPGNG
jgi:uncharacterized protein (DUF983 family)